MFLGKVLTIARPSLLRGLIPCSLLLSTMALAGTHVSATKPNKNTDVSKVQLGHTESRNLAKLAENVAKARPTPSASAIRSIKVAKDYKRGGLLLATIELDGQAQYTHFTLPSPYRLVIDVQNVSTDVPNLIQVGLAELRRVRLGKMDDAVRIVFDATKPQPYEINDEGDTIRIWFGEPKPESTLAAKKPSLNDALTNAVTTPAPATNSSRPVLKPMPPSALTPAKNVRAVPPVQPNPATAEAQKLIALVAIKQPQLRPDPIRLPARTNTLAKIIKPRTPASVAGLRITPPINNFWTKSTDAPPPLQIVKPKVVPQVTAQVRPTADPVAKKEVATELPRPTVPKSNSRVVKATPLPITTEVKNTAPVPASKAVTETAARPVSEAMAPIVTPVTPIIPMPTPRPREGTSQAKSFNASDYAKPDFVGEPINLDLRSTQGKVVDIRDFLRFISDTYKVNFVIDQSVKDTPITVTLQNVPWNQAMEALLRANRLGIKVEGSILRVMSQETVALEDRIRQEQMKARQEATPLVTEMVRLNYARALTGGSSGGGGGSSGGSASGGGSSGGSTSGAGSTAGGSGLDGIIRTRLSQRGNIQADPRTNTLIITDLPENIVAIKEIIAKLDVPEPQVEIESRIVIANRNFARDLGVQIGATAINGTNGSQTTFSTLPGSVTVPAGGSPSDSLRAAGAASILSLTTGLIGTARISAVLSAAETKGNVKTISSPRITAQNNQTANIVNGVQIPVQTESNNTLTVTFVTAALRLEITPQINDNGNVLLKVVAENNSVNTAIATKSAPGINTQRAETTVLVPDGGTTIIGGINIDVESNAQQRTPGLSRVPGLGELFKRRTVSRQTDEILFFITPRIYRPLTAPAMTTSGQQK